MRIRVYLVDDSDEVIGHLRGILAPHMDRFDVLGFATSGTQAVKAIRKLGRELDVVVLDLSMPRFNGIDLIRALRAQGCRARLLVLTSHGDAALIRQAVDAGADGYMLKTASPEDLLAAIEGAGAGAFTTEPTVLKTLANSQPVAQAGAVWLTEVEREILTDVANGLSNGEIAAKRHMSLGGVKRPIADLLIKLNAKNRAHLVTQAARLGLISFVTSDCD